MFEYRWKIPSTPDEDLVLRIHSRSGWFGRKQLTYGQRQVFNRGPFAGIECRFAGSRPDEKLHLRFVRLPDSESWRPAVFHADQELPEVTGGPLPRVITPPAPLAATIGLAYLLMFMTTVMLPAIVKVLNALHMQDATYDASQDIVPWITPIVVTAACLLGILNMKRGALWLFGILIIVEGLLLVLTSGPLSQTVSAMELEGMLLAFASRPVSLIALAMQVALWLVGAAYLMPKQSERTA